MIGKALAELSAEQGIDDLQIISLDDPNIKEIVGAEAIAGRAYHTGDGVVVIVADNIEDFASAIGTITEEGRHIYHRNSNGLEDSEDYASFYGEQFKNYYNRVAGDTPLVMIGSELGYNAGQLGNDWEDDIKLKGTAISISGGKGVFGSGTFSYGKDIGDNGETWYYVAVGGKIGAGAGGGLAYENINGTIEGSDDPKTLEGWSFDAEIGLGTPLIGGTFGATTDLKKGGYTLGVSGGAELEAHMGLGFSYTHVYKEREEALRNLEKEMIRKKIQKQKIEEALKEIRRRVK